MKIVMCYTKCNEEYSSDLNICIEYYSVKKAFSDFVDLCRKHKKLSDEWHLKRQNYPIENWRNFYVEHGDRPLYFEFCGEQFCYGDFYGDFSAKDVECFPEFLELNEWFEKNRRST